MQRRHTGTAGRIENAQVAVYLTYAAPRGHAFVDRALYLPKSWTDDADRCAAAGVPAAVEFATKPTLAAQMVTRAIDAGVLARWVTGLPGDYPDRTFTGWRRRASDQVMTAGQSPPDLWAHRLKH